METNFIEDLRNLAIKYKCVIETARQINAKPQYNCDYIQVSIKNINKENKMSNNKYNLAKIYYQKLDENTVKIEKFENFMSRYDILKKYGHSVLDDYFQKSPHVVLVEKGKVIEYLSINSTNGTFNVGRGKVLSIDKFNTIMNAINRAGHHFVDCIKKYQNKFVEVEI